MILCIQKILRNPLQTIRTHKRSARWHDARSIQKNQVYFYVLAVSKIKKQNNPKSILCSKKHKILWSAFNERSARCTGNHRTLLKESKDLNEWEDSPCSWIRTVNTLQSGKTRPTELQTQSKFQVAFWWKLTR